MQSVADISSRFQVYLQAHERRVAVTFFIVGFIFDILTTGRIDSWLTIGQQLVYLALVTFALTQMLLERGAPPRDLAVMGRLKRWYFEYRNAALHFLLGALLSLYAIFFFKSSSLFASFGFLAVLTTLLIANESARFRALGLPFKFALIALCWLSFAAYVVPILAGSIGTGVFIASMAMGCVPLVATAASIRATRRTILTPLACVVLGFLTLYFFRLIPPVPLSVPFIGIYHGVERKGQAFHLSHERPWWRFWNNGDQRFVARPGDRVFVYFRVFSPTNFADQVQVRWYRKAESWTPQDAVPIRITGGREAGFRGYAFKSNYQPGEWRAQVETADGREIGRIYFTLETAPAAPRTFITDVD